MKKQQEDVDERILNEKMRLLQLKLIEKALNYNVQENYLRVFVRIGGATYYVDVKTSEDYIVAQSLVNGYSTYLVGK